MTRAPLTLSEHIAALPGKIFRRDALMLLLTLAIGGGAAGYAQSKVDEKLHASVDGGIAPLERRMSEVESRAKQQASDIHELQVDIRALYKAVMTGVPQARLEQSPRDGGP